MGLMSLWVDRDHRRRPCNVPSSRLSQWPLQSYTSCHAKAASPTSSLAVRLVHLNKYRRVLGY